MFAALKDFIQSLAGTDRGPGGSYAADSVRLATAALLVEMARIDTQVAAAEQDTVANLLATRFGLAQDEIAALIGLAGTAAAEAPGYHPFTALINRRLDATGKLEVVELLWQVAFADGRLDDHEHHFVRKIADLLYVPHHDFIAAKLRARAAAERLD